MENGAWGFLSMGSPGTFGDGDFGRGLGGRRAVRGKMNDGLIREKLPAFFKKLSPTTFF